MEEIYEIEKSKNLDTATVLQIKDYNSIGWYFDYYNHDKKITFCKECGKIFKKKSNRQECCSEECSKEQKAEYDREYQRERYKNQNSRI